MARNGGEWLGIVASESQGRELAATEKRQNEANLIGCELEAD
jgi:hypothetical protein